MKSNHWLQVLFMSLVITITAVLFSYYYKEYIAPESFTIGSIGEVDYKTLEIKDYLSDDTVLFSQNINDVSFSNIEGTALYEFNFEHKEFDGIKNDYIIYVNNYMINNLTSNAGTISGVHKMKFYDVELNTLCATNINISFSFTSLSSRLRVSLPYSAVGYLLNYFKTDNFIITLAHNPYLMEDKDGEVDEKINTIVNLSKEVAVLSTEITNLNSEIVAYKQQVADLTTAGENKDNEILELQSQIVILQNQVSELSISLDEKIVRIEELEIENSTLLENNTTLQTLVDNQKVTIANLNKTVEDLQKQVIYYEELLEAYENSSKLIVTFKANDIAFEVQVVDEGNLVTPLTTSPVKEDYTFIGWSLDGVNVIDYLSHVITEDTEFIAVFSIKTFTTTFMVDNEIYNTQTIEIHKSAVLPVVPEKVNYRFDGWSINSVDICDPATYEILEDTVFVAMFTKIHNVTFKVNNDIYDSQSIIDNEYLSLPEDPAIEDTIFKGWSLDGVNVIDISTTPITSDMIYIAVFDYWSQNIMGNNSITLTLNDIAYSLIDIQSAAGAPLKSFAGYTNISNSNYRLKGTIQLKNGAEKEFEVTNFNTDFETSEGYNCYFTLGDGNGVIKHFYMNGSSSMVIIKITSAQYLL